MCARKYHLILTVNPFGSTFKIDMETSQQLCCYCPSTSPIISHLSYCNRFLRSLLVLACDPSQSILIMAVTLIVLNLKSYPGIPLLKIAFHVPQGKGKSPYNVILPLLLGHPSPVLGSLLSLFWSNWFHCHSSVGERILSPQGTAHALPSILNAFPQKTRCSPHPFHVALK